MFHAVVIHWVLTLKIWLLAKCAAKICSENYMAAVGTSAVSCWMSFANELSCYADTMQQCYNCTEQSNQYSFIQIACILQ